MFTVDSRVQDGWRTTRVRILETSWGMAVDLTACAVSGPVDDTVTVPISPALGLDVRDVCLAETEVRALAAGLRLIVDLMPGGPGVTVRIRALTWTRPDYQPEVTTIAMAHWAASQFGVPAPEFDVVYDRMTDRYWVSP